MYNDDIRRMFNPIFHRELKEATRLGHKLAHYTSVDTALKILESGEIWMRNTHQMNDFGELMHGIEAADSILEKVDIKSRMAAVLGSMNAKTVLEKWQTAAPEMLSECYITCATVHPTDEDSLGRLSMWRGYGDNDGGVAILLGIEAIKQNGGHFNAAASCVTYGDADALQAQILEVLDNIEQSPRQWGAWPETVDLFLAALVVGVACLKHCGFKEEREWRIIHMPKLYPGQSVLVPRVIASGSPEKIFAIPFKDRPELGISGLSPANLIQGILVGPSNAPAGTVSKLERALRRLGIPNPRQRIKVSNIPLRLT